jgi:hypothetical protein
VIDDAEAQAARCLSEARAEADQIVSERLASVAELTDSIAAQAEHIRQHSERLLELLEAARGELEAGRPSVAGGAPARPPAEAEARVAHLSAVAPVEEPEAGLDRAPEPPADRATPAGARLLATQMAVSGSSREEIEARLRNGFEIEDTAAILDAILGPEE